MTGEDTNHYTKSDLLISPPLDYALNLALLLILINLTMLVCVNFLLVGKFDKKNSPTGN